MNCCTYKCTHGPDCPVRAQQEAQKADTSPSTSNAPIYQMVRIFLLLYVFSAVIAYFLI